MKVILNDSQIARLLNDLADRVLADLEPGQDLAAIGIRSRGEILAQRLSSQLAARLAAEVPCGTLDITLYRDDLNSPQGHGQPKVRTTLMVRPPASPRPYTGRSTRAAMDALIDLGRPRAIRLAVLVDRIGREFPIQADYAAYKTDIAPGKFVQVNLVESDGKDEVVVE